MPDRSATAGPRLAVDALVPLDRRDPAGRSLVLVRRARAPFEGAWALPGGFVEQGEAPEAAALRELEEETGLRGRVAALVGVYGSPGRDPRGHVVSAVYEVALEGPADPRGGDDAADARAWPLAALPVLAFDHARIVADWRAGRRLPLA